MNHRVRHSDGGSIAGAPLWATNIAGLAVRVVGFQLIAALSIGCCLAYVVRSQPVAADAGLSDLSLRLTTFSDETSVLPTSIKDGFSLRPR
ncbi:hypothetical protein LRS73_01825 [Methylobacterium currus]|uniref:hypothetical protein n=1 Tax=Methylobacterium currus TaxID=2051553 RepID=UPI000F510691|nr:hypothetical protein [Methylobacterium currus]UHC16694.1 hypothetical protein LRS73_01825 [Methylobacterium currus]